MVSLIDASSALHAWDKYPKEIFIPLWESWLSDAIDTQKIQTIEPIFEEIGPTKSSECSKWLRANNMKVLPVDDAIAQEALRIKQQLGIAGNDYHPNGVGENDICLIAAAYLKKYDLITDESEQPDLPANKKRYKIPAVCRMLNPQVPCCNFLAYLKLSGVSFG